MDKPMCSVHDKRTGLFSDPFVVRHVGDAVRQFDIVRKDPENKIGKNPEDFDLVQVATFEDLSGKITQLNVPITLQSGRDGLPS